MISEFIRSLLPFPAKSKTSTGSIINSSKAEKVDYILAEFNSALDFENENLERASNSWNLYKGYGGSSYPTEVKKDIIKDGRNPFEGNIIRQKVDGLAGSIIKNFFDISFEPVNSAHSAMTEHLKELMLIDKELLDWSTAYRQLVVDGLIHLGVEEIYIDYRYSPFGNIGFRSVAPNHILLDPHWTSNNAWDLKRAFKVAYLTANQIKEIYNTKAEEIEMLVQMKDKQATDFDNGSIDEGVLHYGLSPTYGDKYRVIEYHNVKKEKKSIEIISATGEIVPEGNDEFKKEWAVLNNVDLSMGVMKKNYDVDVYFVTSVCPTLSRTLVLEDKQGLVQIGRLPFFPWSSGRINGTNSGIPDLLKSIQETLHYRESMLDFIIGTNAANGMMGDPDIVDGDAAKMKEIEDEINKPGYFGWTSPGALSSGREHFKQFPRQQPDYGIKDDIMRMLDMADRVSKQPAAMDGRSEGSEETGILYARKQMQAEVTHTLLVKGLEQHWNDKGEAYFLTAKKLYSGVYREFYAIGSDKKIELNVPTVTPSGEVIDNDISMLPRMKVIISQSPEGVTTRLINRSINTELLSRIGPENPLSRARVVRNVMKTLDHSKVEREELEQDAKIEYEFAKENLVTQTMGLKVQQMQLVQQMQPQQPQPMQQEGQPSEQPEAPNPMGGQGQGQPEAPQVAGNDNSTMQGNNMSVAEGI